MACIVVLVAATLTVVSARANLRAYQKAIASNILEPSFTPKILETISDAINPKGTPSESKHPAFELVRVEQVDEFALNVTLYRHKATGAEVMSVETDDDNKVFGAAFRTPVSDSTGVAHILEHSVLCGSKKYPVKDPFIQLRRTSLNTYLNAMTYPDRTVYPIASQNLKDFYNLANVYLDAVLHPRAIDNPMVLAQEGWHYELKKESDPLIYRGIVYNEMKGARSNPTARLHKKAMAELLANTTYAFISGGDPTHIPELTFDKFKKFYNQYYHPANARFYFYGDDPVPERLALLESYLSEFGSPPAPVEESRIQTQKMWSSPRREQVPYPVTEKEAAVEGGAKHMVTNYWLLSEEAMSATEQLGMSLVSSLLLDSTSAPLRRALIESKLGTTLTGYGWSDYLKQPTFSVGMKGVKHDDVPKVEALIHETLQKIYKDGFNKDAMEAEMNSLEFGIKEFAAGTTKRGISIYLMALKDWIYERDPLQGMRFTNPISAIRDHISKGDRWLESLMKFYLLDNNARLTLEAVPDATMVAREAAEEKKKLAATKAAFSKSELADIIKETKALQIEQKSKDTKEQLDTLPKLSVADLSKKSKDLPILVSEKHGVTVLTHEVDSSGILYCQVVMDLGPLPVEYLKLLPVFVHLLFEVGTSKLGPAEFHHQIGALTGGINAYSYTAIKRGENGTIGDLNDAVLKVIVSGRAMAHKANDLFDLMLMGITDSKLDNRARVLEYFRATKTRMQSSLKSSGSSFSQKRLFARRSLTGYVDEVTAGISYFQALPSLLEMAEKKWPEMLSKLQAMNKLLLARDGILINYSGDKTTLKKAGGAADKFIQSLLKAGASREKVTIDGPTLADAKKGKPQLRLANEDEGFIVQTPVNYVVKGGELFGVGERVTGAAQVAMRMVSQSYMWDKVRVLGGAYGGGCSVSSHSGTFSCYSYRDPNLKRTLEVFDSIATYLENLKLSDEDIQQLIIGAVGELDKPSTPSSKGYTSLVRYLLNVKIDVLQSARDEMLATTLADFKLLARRIREKTAALKSSIFSSKAGFAKANSASVKITTQELH